MICDPFDQAWTSLVMFASAPWEARPGVSVLAVSLMSGPPLPLVSALVQSVPLAVHGIQSVTTLVFLYWGNSLFHCSTTPFIQVAWDATPLPIRQTTSLAGADDVDPVELGLPLELQPAMPAAAPASATTAPTAAADLVNVTARSPFPAGLNGATSSGRTPPAGRSPGATPTLDGELYWLSRYARVEGARV